MAGVLHALATAAIKEVNAGGVDWRLRRVSSADLARAQAGALALLPVDPTPTKGKGKKQKEETTQDFLRRVSPEALAQTADMTDAMACASVSHARIPGGEWEPVTLVPRREKADPEAGRLWVGDLAMDVRSALFQAAMAHSTEDGEAVARLESFRAGA